MRRLELTAEAQEILDVVREWAAALADERFDEAMALLRPSDQWSPATVQTWIRNYGWHEPPADGSIYRVTDMATASGATGSFPRHEVDRLDRPATDGRVASVWFDLPLNGRWSDLTATFVVRQLDESLVLELADLHVM